MRSEPAKLITSLVALLIFVAGCGSGGGEDTLLLSPEVQDTPSLEVAVAPREGPTLGGTTVTLTGPSADSVRGVNIEERPVSNLKIVDETTVTFVTPPHDPGTVNLTVFTTFGNATLVDAFTYMEPPPPALTTLIPNAVPLEGAQGLELQGSGFIEGETVVNLGDLEVTPTSVSPTSIRFNAPPHAAGTVGVTVTTPVAESDEVEDGLTYTEGPTVASLDPAIGPLEGLDGVTLTGTGFVEDATVVRFDGRELTPRSVSSTSLVFDAPPHAAGTVDVAVTTPGGDSGELPGGFLYAGPPEIGAISPARGKVGGGETVTLTGSNLFGATEVTFGGVSADKPIVNDEGTQLTVTAPAHSAGLVDIEVATPVGTDSSVNGYEYIPEPSISTLTPAVAIAYSQTTVTITGSGFTDASDVRFRDHEAESFTVDSDTQITAVTRGHGAGLYDVSVTTPGGTVTANNAFTFVSTPSVYSVYPDAGPNYGNQFIDIYGTGLLGTTSVTIGGSPAKIESVDDTYLSVNIPSGDNGPADIVVTNPAGSYTLVDGYTYVPSPSLSWLMPDTGPVSGGTDVTLFGANMETTTEVTVNDIEVDFTFDSSGNLEFTTPPGVLGSVDVGVTTPGGYGQLSNGFTYVGQPTLTGLSPSSGSQGTLVDINGTNLQNASVTFGGVRAGVYRNSATQVRAYAPTKSPGTVDVVVTTPAGSATLEDAFTYPPPP